MKISNKSLYIVSKPIGNLNDITLRALEVLKKSDIVICEDTRHSIKLLNHFKIKKKLISYHKFNEKKQSNIIIQLINQGKILSLISDAGTPLLSDPGQLLLDECLKNEIEVVPIPGVSSITAAMSVSGFNDQFLFYGFLPKKEKELENVLSSISKYNYSQIFFIPAIKINFYLKKFNIYYSGRNIMIAKEITKLHERFYRGKIEEFKMLNLPIKGELTIVISGGSYKKKIFDESKVASLAKKFLKKYSLKDTVELIASTENLNKKKIYELCLKIKNEKIN